MSRGAALLVAVCLSFSPPAEAEWMVDHEASVFAVVTHKEGLAAGLAHEHLVVADDYEVAIQPGGLFTENGEAPGSAEMELAAAELRVDDPALAAQWQERLLELGLIAEPFAELSDKDRQKIRKSMLGEKQLDAEAHPTIRATLSDIRALGGGDEPRYVGTLALEVRGETASRDVEFEIDVGEDGRLHAQVTASFAFSDFGIEPYSAMLGAIRVADAFDVFVVVVASP